MNKVFLSSLMLFGSLAHADTTPTFSFSTGVLFIPFISTSAGPYTATLQIDTKKPTTTFKINNVGGSAVTNDSFPPPTFDFGSNLLNLPKVNTSSGVYTVKLRLQKDNTFFLNLTTDVQPYSASNTNNNSDPGTGPSIGGCPIFPANNVWNTPVETLPLHPRSDAWIAALSNAKIQTDFGEAFGQPYNLVSASEVPKYSFSFQYPSESDIGPYPIPNDFLRENTSDRRLFIIDKEACKLYELYNAESKGTQWSARRGAIWDLKSNALRTDGFGSADEAGLPQIPGLVRYEEVQAGSIKHALRFTFPNPAARIWPARHSHGNLPVVTDIPPMGAHLRLKANYNISNFAPELQVILKAMKTYGIILADTGAALYLSGTPSEHWDDELLSGLRKIKGSDFEAVDSECMMVNANSGEANIGLCPR